MADEPFILPTFTFDAFRKNRLSVTSHIIGSGKTIAPSDNAGGSSATLMRQLKDEGIEIDSPYESFFTDGAPPEIRKR